MRLKRIQKKTIAMLMAIAVVFSYFIPTNLIKASAPTSNPQDYGIISINGALIVEERDNATEIEVTYSNGIVNVTGEGLYSEGNNIYSKNDVTVDCTPNEGFSCELWKDGTNTQGTTVGINNIVPSTVYNIDAMFENNQNPQQDGNSIATINLHPGEGTYTINGQERSYDDQIELRINGSIWDHEAGNTISYDSAEQDDSVEMTFETLWINRFYDTIEINGDTYDVIDYIDFDDRTSWLTHNNGTQMISFTIPDVPKEDNYDIIVKHGENNGTKYLATFLWTADPAQAGGHNYIGHARLEFVKAEYSVGTTTYIVEEAGLENTLRRDGEYMVATDNGFLTYGVMADVDYDDGGLTLPGESIVTMRVVPDYGYQVTSVNGGSNFTTTDEGVSEFTVTVHNGEAGYFQATVEAVDDEVIANSDSVDSGTVVLGENEIDAGTVQLSVDDVDLDEDKIKDFEEAAGEYEITNYFDINLNQVFYRGTADSVWTNQIHHLDNEATISLKLDEGLDINNIVFVHNIDDGDEFEIIEIESWDPETRIVTFKTKSFSSYAIANKVTSSNSDNTNNKVSSNPKTGDSILFYVGMLSFGILALLIAGLYTSKKNLVDKKVD